MKLFRPAIVLCLAALAATPGTVSAATPKLRWAHCYRQCFNTSTVKPLGWVKVAGSGLRKGQRVIFPVRGTSKGHSGTTRVAGSRLVARVPSNGRSGRVYVQYSSHGRTNKVGPIAVTTKAPTPPPGTTPSGTAFDGSGMWVWYVSQSSGGSAKAMISQAKAHGVRTILVKAGDSTHYWSQFSPQLVSALKAGGLRVCAWQYVYGSSPSAEASVGAEAVRNGADCLVIDAEAEYEGRYAQAQTYVSQLRSGVGASFPIGLAGFPYVDYHPAYPYSVFLGPGGAQFNVPQTYWKDIGGGVDTVVAHMYRWNRPYGRAIMPIGQTYNAPASSEIVRFRQLSAAGGSSGLSWWDWQETSAAGWTAIGQSFGRLSGPFAADFSTLARGSQGDLVIWAQQHLRTAGRQVSIDGAFGPGTEQAVRDFQRAASLPQTGRIDTATWTALLHYAPARVSWRTSAKARPSGASPAGRTGPPTATLKARRYEIRPQRERAAAAGG